MTLKEQIDKDLIQALKDNNTFKRGTLQMVKAKIVNEEIKKQGKYTDEDTILVIQKEIKEIKETLDSVHAAGRNDLVQENEARLAILTPYAPVQLTKEEILALLEHKGAEKGMKMGDLMGLVLSTHKSLVDGKMLSQVVRENYF